MFSSMIKESQKRFEKMVFDFGSDPYHLISHVPEVGRWAEYILKSHPQADREVVLIAAWLHDLGHYPISTDVDHAISGEQRAKDFLEQQNYPTDKTLKVLHCIRSHRCKDVLPESLEAKIVACADSASHMTEEMYLNMAQDDKRAGQEFRVYAKMERDYRDLGAFPEIQKELTPLYNAWREVIKAYEKIKFI